MNKLINKLYKKINLTQDEMISAVNDMLNNDNKEKTVQFLTLLCKKGETVEEICGTVKALKSMMVRLDSKYPTLDIVGTGGDGFNTVNISTGSALLAASCGVKIAKHGNRAVSSMTGSADMLETCGVNIDERPSQILQNIDKYNFGFLFAPRFHPALHKLRLIRKKMGIPTIFNLVGPLLNPCTPKFLMIGVSKKTYLNIFSQVLIHIGVERAIVFNCNGLDEICTVAPTDIIEVNKSEIINHKLYPDKFGFSYCVINDLRGGSAKENVELVRSALQGNENPISDTLILNAGVACYLYGKSPTIKDGILIAKSAHHNREGIRVLNQLIMNSN